MTTARGVDYAWDKPSPEVLRTAGYGFACRYLSYDTTGKNLTLSEAQSLAASGISIVSNWEYNERAALGGYDQGVKDAHAAQIQHAECGGPADRPIYFSLDWDVQPENMWPVFAYLDGCAAVIGRQRVGVYGGYFALDQIRTHGKAAWFWQTYAWSHGQWLTAIHIRQVHNDFLLQGVNVDEDEADTHDFGQWMPVGTPNPPAFEEDPMLTHWHNFAQGDGTFANPNPYAKRGQALLNAAGVTDENGHQLAEDGMAGPHTDYAIRTLQRRSGLAVDGVFGPHTLSVALYGTDYA